eukprot:1418964-Alexandrium_andersonii.AAC.1
MSASLVGSEMCIRDSSGALSSSLELSGPRWSSPELTGALRGSLEISAAPVSYTHLTLPTICSV